MIRIDNLRPGTKVTLRFHGGNLYGQQRFEDEPAKFIGITGEGDERRATFESKAGQRKYRWDAYRHRGHWAYGTSADRLQLVSIDQ